MRDEPILYNLLHHPTSCLKSFEKIDGKSLIKFMNCNRIKENERKLVFKIFC